MSSESERASEGESEYISRYVVGSVLILMLCAVTIQGKGELRNWHLHPNACFR